VSGGLSALYRAEAQLTADALVRAWAPELNVDERDLGRLLAQDIISGRLDHFGPELGGERWGVGVLLRDLRVNLTRGADLRELMAAAGPATLQWMLPSIVIRKEAVLAFAESRGLTPPSWWGPSSDDLRADAPAASGEVIAHAAAKKQVSSREIEDFAKTYVAKMGGQHGRPTQAGLLEAWSGEGRSGHRQQLCAALATLIGTPKLGRPPGTRRK
jgi:hypothetical protein